VSNAIPTPLRAVAGLAAATIDEAKRLPARLVGFPVLAVSTALQTSLKVQQQYADLVIRGDELLSPLRPEPAEPPSWAQFDDDPPADEPPAYDIDADFDVDADGRADLPGAPVDGYDELSVPQLRGRLRRYSEDELQELLDYETATLARAPYLTMLGNRLHTVRQG
jgi:hypothetical protein